MDNKLNTGSKFGLLTIIEAIESPNRDNRRGLWLCKCKCGKTITLSGYNLSYRKSCGCMVRKAARARGIGNRSPESVTYTAEYHKYQQEYRDGMSKSEWLEVCVLPCVYCGDIDTRNRASDESYKPVIPLSDDEIELYKVQVNSIVMVDDKPHACCGTCRKMRGKLSHEMFIDRIKLVYSHYGN